MTAFDDHLEAAYEDAVSGGIEFDLENYSFDFECEVCGAPLPDFDIEASAICRECRDREFDNGDDFVHVDQDDIYGQWHSRWNASPYPYAGDHPDEEADGHPEATR